MGNILRRKAYEEFACYGMPDDYPKSTEEAATELRKRGGDASVPALNYLIKQGTDHSTLSRTRRLIDVKTHEAVFQWMLQVLAG